MKRNTLRRGKKPQGLCEQVDHRKFMVKETLICADHIVQTIISKIKWHIEYQEIKHKIKPFTISQGIDLSDGLRVMG